MTDKEELLQETLNRLSERMMLTELAKTRSEIIEKLEKMSDLVLEHLIYCFLWKDSQDYDHWKSEIHKFLNIVPRFKGTNKRLDLNTLKDWFLNTRLEDIEDGIQGYVKTACFNEKKLVPDYNKEELIKFTQTYFIWLCETLAKQHNVSKPEVYNKIDELLGK